MVDQGRIIKGLLFHGVHQLICKEYLSALISSIEWLVKQELNKSPYDSTLQAVW